MNTLTTLKRKGAAVGSTSFRRPCPQVRTLLGVAGLTVLPIALALAPSTTLASAASATTRTTAQATRHSTAAVLGHNGPAPVTKAYPQSKAGILPPGNPPANIVPNPNFLSDCSGSRYDNSSGCVNATLAAIANGRSAEGLPAMVLPTDWYSLTAQEQLFVATNLEREVRGLAPLSSMSSALDGAALQGAEQSNDPSPPAGFPWSQWGSNWAGAVGNPLEAMYFWMYDDGLGSSNIDCQSAGAPGCWGHRDNVLLNLACQPCVMGSGFDATGYQGYPGWAELLVDTSGNPAADFSWSSGHPLPGGHGRRGRGDRPDGGDRLHPRRRWLLDRHGQRRGLRLR